MVKTRPRIDCVAVCIDYDDFLALTVDRYRETFDEVIVVTTASDERTIALCEAACVRCVLSPRVHFRGLDFNLPALINDGCGALVTPEWVCKIDPDIYLPKDARAHLDGSLDEPDTLWGTRRYFCDTPARFQEFSIDEDYGLLEPPYEEAGDDVIGFFQLFNVRSRYLRDRQKPYEEDHYAPPSLTNDRLFSSQWPPDRRRRLPFDVVHLGLEARGRNWKGRRSPRFDA